jgi:trans-2,3-dihydro-3-hydroxyanthranilate isomerase
MGRRYHTLDVFTDRPLAGNPLAVVHDSEGLDTAAMQAIAREFNLSETVFILPATDAANTARMRIFTPGSELPFAGHPTVGTAVLLATLRAPDMLGRGLVIALEQEIGLVSVDVRQAGRKPPRAEFALPRLPHRLDCSTTTEIAARALGLEPADIGLAGHAIGAFAVGGAFTMVPVASPAVLARARPSAGPVFDAAFGAGDHAAAFVYTRDPQQKTHHWRARMFAPSIGIAEDPATGSAVAAFAGAIMAFEAPGDGRHQAVIAQGYEMGRPSDIVLTMVVEDGTLVQATIGGSAVIISEGTLRL